MTNQVIESVKKALPENIRILMTYSQNGSPGLFDFPTCHINLGFKNQRYTRRSCSAFILVAPANALLQHDELYDDYNVLVHDELRWVVLYAPDDEVWKELNHNLRRELKELNFFIYDDYEVVQNKEKKSPDPPPKKHVAIYPVPTTTDAYDLTLPELVAKDASLKDVITMLNMMIKEYVKLPNIPLQIKFENEVDADNIIISLEMKNFTILEILTYIINHTDLLCRINNNIASFRFVNGNN